MERDALTHDAIEEERYELAAEPPYEFELSRRHFLAVFGAGLLVTVSAGRAWAQAETGERRGRGGWGRRGGVPIDARIHFAGDGTITVLTGKVEVGQGSRTELTQAAAEELRVAPGKIQMMMADTTATPDDGGTYGSQTTPRTVPAVREAAAAARGLLLAMAAKEWGIGADGVEVADGVIREKAGTRRTSYAELAGGGKADATLSAEPSGSQLTATDEWKVMGKSLARPNLRDIVMGRHRYPSDIVRPGMLYGKVLRPPSFGATLKTIDLAPAKAMKGVVVVRDGDFVGCAAATSWKAAEAVEALAKTVEWNEKAGQPSSEEVYDYLSQHAEGQGESAEIAAALKDAAKSLRATYTAAYIQHVPMEPRAAVAEWDGDQVQVWTGTQAPTRVQGELARAFNIAQGNARVVVPDTGGGFGGKHTGECAVEAARLARAAGKPVHVRWTREEEFTWAYFRPAAVIQTAAALDGDGRLAAWEFVNINSGGSGLETPYEVAKKNERFQRSDSPLRQGSYRGLAATANHFAREGFIDELAHLAGQDPLDFRRANLKNERILRVLKEATDRFDWAGRKKPAEGSIGFGLACGTEKGSCVAACAEVEVDRAEGTIRVRRVAQAFECGGVINPHNLRAQNEGAIVQGIGGALREAMEFEDGRITNGTLMQYAVPRFKDVPKIDVVLVDRPELGLFGAGETPIMAIAPAIANAVFDAIGVRVRKMPMEGNELRMA